MKKPPRVPLLKRVEAWLREHPGEELTPADIATKFNTSRRSIDTRLCEARKRGDSPLETVRVVRLRATHR